MSKVTRMVGGGAKGIENLPSDETTDFQKPTLMLVLPFLRCLIWAIEGDKNKVLTE